MGKNGYAVILCLIVCCICTASALSGSNGGDWLYGREITIKEQTGTLLDFYSLPVVLDDGNFDLFKANPDGSDIRVTDKDGYERAFWIEEWNVSARYAKIWISVPRIPAGNETQMRLYYGNAKAESASNGGATFLFFDDFSGPSFKEENWISRSEDPQTENGYLRLVSGKGQIASMVSFDRPVAAEFRYRTTEDQVPSSTEVSLLSPQDFTYGGDKKAYSLRLLNNRHSTRSGGITQGNDTKSLGGSVSAPFDATGWNTYSLIITNESLQGTWGGVAGPWIYDTSLSSGMLTLTASCPSGCNGSAEWDWISVRKYAGAEPVVALSGEYSAKQLLELAEPTKAFPQGTTPTKSPGPGIVAALFAFAVSFSLIRNMKS